jgi:iron complex outermembrane receptor protein
MNKKTNTHLNLSRTTNFVYALQALQFFFAMILGLSNALVYASSMTLDLPAAPLPQALNQLAQAMNIQIRYDAMPLSRKMASSLKGNYTVDGALDFLLADTGFQAQKNSAGHYIIARTKTKAGEAEPTMLPTVKVTGSMEPDAPENPSYTRNNATSATKTSTPVLKTPISIQTVPRAVFQDQQAVQIEDAVKNVSGVFPGFTFGGLSEEFMIRGFNTGFVSYRDGFLFPAARLSLANIERVEVVKGAAANLYGRIEPGGMINLITKRPQEQSYYSVNQQFGSYGQYQTLADATGALNKDGTLLYRINFEYLNRNSFRDFGFHERAFVAPSLTWKITPKTQFDLDFMYSTEKFMEDYGVAAVGNRPANVSRSRFLGEPTDRSNLKLYNTVATLTHALNDNWQVRARFNHVRRDTVDPQTTGFSLNEVTGEMQRGYSKANATGDTFLGTVDITGRFHTAGVEHNVLAGWDYYNSTSNVKMILLDASPINIFRPQYSNINLASSPDNFFIDQTTQWNGVYFQDQIKLFDKLYIMGGGRYDWASRELGTAFGEDRSLADASAASTKVNNARFSPRAGIVYQPFEWLSFFGNYAQSLGSANTAFDASGSVLNPQTGEQFEGGFKTSFFDGRLNSNVAYYHLTKQSLAIQVPGRPFSLPIGEARSQGVEIDIAGEVAKGLSLILTYAYTDAKILKGDDQGNQLFNVPKHAGSLWARYDMQYEPLRGLSFGAGIFAQGKRPGDTANTYFLPDQTRLDAMIRYRLPVAKSRLSVQLNAYNLADETLYGGTLGDRFSVNVGMPRTFIGSIHYAM